MTKDESSPSFVIRPSSKKLERIYDWLHQGGQDVQTPFSVGNASAGADRNRVLIASRLGRWRATRTIPDGRSNADPIGQRSLDRAAQRRAAGTGAWHQPRLCDHDARNDRQWQAPARQ